MVYKLFASLLLARLQAAGAESRLTRTQFGFRRGCGTNDAVFLVRRRIDLALAQRYGQAGLVALDLKKHLTPSMWSQCSLLLARLAVKSLAHDTPHL